MRLLCVVTAESPDYFLGIPTPKAEYCTGMLCSIEKDLMNEKLFFPRQGRLRHRYCSQLIVFLYHRLCKLTKIFSHLELDCEAFSASVLILYAIEFAF